MVERYMYGAEMLNEEELKVMQEVLENQKTTDKLEAGEYVECVDSNIYYIVDDDYDITITKVIRQGEVFK